MNLYEQIDNVLNQIKDTEDFDVECLDIQKQNMNHAHHILHKMEAEKLIYIRWDDEVDNCVTITYRGIELLENGGYAKKKRDEWRLKWLPLIISSFSLIVSIVAIILTLTKK